ncbi:hypothetical protein VPH35_089520 [Triticum aestivum]
MGMASIPAPDGGNLRPAITAHQRIWTQRTPVGSVVHDALRCSATIDPGKVVGTGTCGWPRVSRMHTARRRWPSTGTRRRSPPPARRRCPVRLQPSVLTRPRPRGVPFAVR